MILGVPILGKPEVTKEFVQSITDTLANPADFHLVLIDNASTIPYKADDYVIPYKLTVIRKEKNEGFYKPLQELYTMFGDNELIGLCHNDIYFYEKGWDNRMRFAFATYPDMGLIGLCGSPIADIYGGRGRGTLMNFRGERGAKGGMSFTELFPAVLLDSLFMLFRGSAIPKLLIDESITPCHFYDKIWSMRMTENKYKVAVMGIEIDHMGGTTSTAGDYQEDAKRWCREHGLELEKQPDGSESGDLTLYHEGERRFLNEYRDQKKMIPCRIDSQYKLWRI